MYKVRFLKICDYLYWTLIAIITIISFFKSISGELTEATMISISNIKIIINIIISIIILFILSIFKVFPLSIIYFILKIVLKKHKKEKLDENDLKKFKSYYREIINNYSPAVLGYIDNYEVNDKTVVSTLMSLESKGKIKINNKQINILDSQIDDLDNNEEYILSNIKNLKNLNMINYKSKIINDCLNNELIEVKDNLKKKLLKKIAYAIICFLVGIITSSLLPSNIVATGTLGIIFALIISVLIIFPIMYFAFTIYSILPYVLINIVDPYVRTKKAKELNKSLEGLKRYLIDFSSISDKPRESMIIWNDYLIYSVLFGQNEKIMKEYKEIIESN